MTSDEPQYSANGLIGLSLIHSEWAHSIFYFEDANYEPLYERLLKKIMPNLRQFAVACTGGKAIAKGVAKRSKETAIPSVIVVDKDYDDLLGTFGKNNELGIIYLRKYSIENYLAEVEALIEIAIESLAGAGKACKQQDIKEKLSDRNQFIDQLRDKLTEIGRWFIFVRRHGLPIQSSKIPGEKVFAGSDPVFPIPTDWYEDYRDRVIECVNTGPDWLMEGDQITECLAEAFNTDCRPWGHLDPKDHIVGKHLLFGLLCYLDDRLGTSLREMGSQELYIRLLNHVNLKPLAYLKDEIAARLEGTSAIEG